MLCMHFVFCVTRKSSVALSAEAVPFCDASGKLIYHPIGYLLLENTFLFFGTGLDWTVVTYSLCCVDLSCLTDRLTADSGAQRSSKLQEVASSEVIPNS
jgi:hypothetical protein